VPEDAAPAVLKNGLQDKQVVGAVNLFRVDRTGLKPHWQLSGIAFNDNSLPADTF